jgi:hypothetical protein
MDPLAALQRQTFKTTSAGHAESRFILHCKAIEVPLECQVFTIDISWPVIAYHTMCAEVATRLVPRPPANHTGTDIHHDEARSIYLKPQAIGVPYIPL